MLVYGSYLGYSLLSETLEALVPPDVKAAMQGWSIYLNTWGIVIAADPRIGTVFLLMLMTAPLAGAFLAYHIYLIWAGTTTNETSKWSYWKDDVEDGFVFKTKRSLIFENPLPMSPHDQAWPVHTDQILVTDDDPPMEGCLLASDSNRIVRRPGRDVPPDPRWKRLDSMRDVDNIYDLGFWNNLRDVMGFSVRQSRKVHR
jgi:palmitoyltransferase